MNKKVIIAGFIIIGCLVFGFMAWQQTFTDDGIIVSGYNSIASAINGQYEKIAGSGQTILPEWNSDTNGTGTEIDTE